MEPDFAFETALPIPEPVEPIMLFNSELIFIVEDLLLIYELLNRTEDVP
jgi:hypothetical protein